MSKNNNYFRASILTLIITILICPYADSNDHSHESGMECIAHNHFGSSIHYQSRTAALKKHYSAHHSHKGPVESAHNMIEASRWHTHTHDVHFHFIDNIITFDSYREVTNSKTGSYNQSAYCSLANCPGLESANQYFKESDLSSSNHIKQIILSYSDLPPPL